MDNDIIDINGICEILNKTDQTVRNLIKKKEIPAKKIANSWYSSKFALSMYAAGFNVEEIYEKASEKMLENTYKLLS